MTWPSTRDWRSEFVDLLCADEAWLRAEFDALIRANFDDAANRSSTRTRTRTLPAAAVDPPVRQLDPPRPHGRRKRRGGPRARPPPRAPARQPPGSVERTGSSGRSHRPGKEVNNHPTPLT